MTSGAKLPFGFGGRTVRPTGVTLIALYNYLAALMLAMFGIALLVGGKLISMLGGADSGILPRTGFMIGVVGGSIFLAFAVVYAIAGFGMWSMREWARTLSIILAVISLVFSLPSLLLLAMTMQMFMGSYRIARIAISVFILWYLFQAETKAAFRAAA